ncbi:MAG: sugar ABC transporter substrate-binding protein [Actinobacteria bacterium]|nr:sugar ABC transporter substrate-binding protein [Actinomycetota bacterium]
MRHVGLKGRTRRLAAAGLTAAMVTTVAYTTPSWASVVPTAKARATAKHFVLGSVVDDMTNPFLAVMAQGEKQEAAKLGMSVKVLSGNVSGSISLSQQVSDVQQLIGEHVSAILMTASDSVGIIPAVKLANKAGIPVVAVNTPVGTVTGAHSVNTEGANVVTFVGADNTAYGVAEGRLVVQALGGKGNVVMIHGTLGTEPDTLRFAGIKSVFSKYPGIHVIDTMTDNWQNSENISDVQDLLSKYPGNQLNAVVATGPEMYAGAEYARGHGNKTWKFVAGDYSRQVRAAIKSGALYGTVDQDPATQGMLGAKYAYEWVTGKSSLVPRPISYTNLPLITSKNVGTVPALWNS